MAEQTPQKTGTAEGKRKMSLAEKIIRIVFKVVLGIILLIAVVALLILTPPVQNFIKNKATTWLSKKLDTKVEVGKIYIGFPKKVVLENIYVEDKTKDTLLYGGAIKVDIALLKLLRSEVEVSSVQVSDLTAKVNRILPDTIYNFQFIVDAFSSPDTVVTKPTDSSSMKITVKSVELDKIRLLYDDNVTGNDLVFWMEHFDTEIDRFDLDKMRFSVPEFNIEGINADYKNDTTVFYTKISLDKLSLSMDDINVPEQSVKLDLAELKNTSAEIRLGKNKVAQHIAAKADSLAEKAAVPGEDSVSGWRVVVNKIRFDNNNIVFTDDNSPVLQKGMDYSHLGIKQLTLHADDFLFSPDSIAGSIIKGEMEEKSGFVLNKLQTDFLYASNQAYLHDLLLETPGTTLRRSVSLKYSSIDALQKDIGQLKMDVALNNSRVQVKDILIFAPFLAQQPAFSSPAAFFTMDGNITGSVVNMNINKLELRGFNNTNINVRGNISGLPDANKVGGNLVINNISTSKKDIQLLAPKGTLPANITLPETMKLTGTIAGNVNAARADLNLVTDLGGASVKGNISNPTDKKKVKYNGTITARQLDLGVIMQNDSMYGPLTASVTAAGTGFDPKTMNASLNGTVNSAVYNKYNYKNLNFTGGMIAQKGKLKMDIKDPNITVSLDADADLSGKFPAIKLNTTIDTVNVTALHFMSDTLTYKGNITADFPNTDPADLTGNLFIAGSRIIMGSKHYSLDTISLRSGKSDTGEFLVLNSQGINAALTGKYNLAQLGSVFQQTIQPYYALDSIGNKDTLDDYDFNFTAQITKSPLFTVFLPSLTRMDPIKMNAHFATDEGFNAVVDAPIILMGTNRIQKFKLNAGTKNNEIVLNAGVEQFAAGESFIFYSTTVDATIADNKIKWLVKLKDQDKKNKYALEGIFEQTRSGGYAISLQPSNLLLNYDKWDVPNDNIIRINNGDINIHNFAISRKGQALSINSQSEETNSPLDIKFTDFRIATISAFAKQDTAIADGTVNGAALVTNIAEQPTFTSDINISDLTLKGDTVGNLAIKVNNNTPDIFNADIKLTGKGSEMDIAGTYNVNPGPDGSMDMVMDIKKLEMTAVEALSFGSIRRGAGYLTGKFNVKGNLDKPSVNGDLDFHQVGFSPAMLGSYFNINDEAIAVNDEGIHFDSFTILDSTKNKLILNGWARTSNFTNYNLDLDLTADNFEALNSTKQNSKLFYGKFNFDTDLHIGGTEKSPSVKGSLRVNDKTKLTIVLPQTDPGVVEREGIVRFVDVDSVRADTIMQLAIEDSLGRSDLVGMDISVNIETDKKADFTLVVDEGNGDFLNVKGAANLTGGIDPSGKTTLTGNYEIEEGSYQLSVNLLRRKFIIPKGSRITWLGEPTRANLDLTAVYVANIAPITLVQNQASTANINMYKQKLPFNIELIIKGEMLKPEITFDIRLPANDSIKFNVSSEVTNLVESKLALLREEPSELNKQVFAALLFNTFVAENPFASNGGGTSTGTMARQSVSMILSEQLNSLAADLIKGVDINFDLASTDDYTTGSRETRTDLNVSMSKQLLNDRLKVTVGNNFELEGPAASASRNSGLAGNVALDYLLSKDGRYMLRGYRKNEYEAELYGYVIETGVNFILTFDYNRLRELFHSPKEKKPVKKKNNI